MIQPKRSQSASRSSAGKRSTKTATRGSKGSRGETARTNKPGRSQGRSTKARSGSGQTTTDHDEIREWVEQRGGHPATVKSRSRGREKAGILRIDFPGYSGRESLEEISWEEFFDQFEESQLAFLYQDKTAGGKTSRFNKLVSRES